MEDISFRHLSRRDFVKYTLTMAAFASMPPALLGCGVIRTGPWSGMDSDRSTALTNCRIIDVKAGQAVSGASVIFEKGRVSNITHQEVTPSDRLLVMDMGGRYVCPGLIDGHCHTTLSAGHRVSTNPILLLRHYKQLRRQYTSTVESGVTTVRDLGSFTRLINEFEFEIRKGVLRGPRIVRCNRIVNTFGSHPDVPPTQVHMLAGMVLPFLGLAMTNFKNDFELERDLNENIDGASFIKLTVDNVSLLCGKDKIPVYTDGQLKKIFNFAYQESMPVAAHCLFEWGFNRITDYPVHSLEHIVSDTYLSDAQIKKMADKKITIVPTMTLGETYLMDEGYTTLPPEFDTEFIRKELEIRREYIHNVPESQCDPVIHADCMDVLQSFKTVGRDHFLENGLFIPKPEPFFGVAKYGVENLRKMKQAGVLIGCGMDAGTPMNYFGALYRELEFYARIGFKNDELLRCATINNAKILGIEDKAGSIEPGKYADFVVYDENPLENVLAFRKPVIVIKEGEILHSTLTPENGKNSIKVKAA